MADKYFSCQAKECFGNCFGKCHILTDKIQGKPCPFYKARKDFRDDRVSDVIDRWESRMSERKGNDMIVGFHDDEIYSRMFEEWILDRGLELNSEADTRCAIKAFSNYIMNMVADFYDVDQKEGDVSDLN